MSLLNALKSLEQKVVAELEGVEFRIKQALHITSHAPVEDQIAAAKDAIAKHVEDVHAEHEGAAGSDEVVEQST